MDALGCPSSGVTREEARSPAPTTCRRSADRPRRPGTARTRLPGPGPECRPFRGPPARWSGRWHGGRPGQLSDLHCWSGAERRDGGHLLGGVGTVDNPARGPGRPARHRHRGRAASLSTCRSPGEPGDGTELAGRGVWAAGTSSCPGDGPLRSRPCNWRPPIECAAAGRAPSVGTFAADRTGPRRMVRRSRGRRGYGQCRNAWRAGGPGAPGDRHRGGRHGPRAVAVAGTAAGVRAGVRGRRRVGGLRPDRIPGRAARSGAVAPVRRTAGR